MNDLLISGGRIVDAANNFDSTAELLVSDGKISECSTNINKPSGSQIIDAKGKLVIPGLVDSHVHIAGGEEGFFMLAQAGVTTALDLSSQAENIVPYLKASETGLNISFLFSLIPHRTVSDNNPGKTELRDVIERALSSGAMGIKIVAGHYPLTPESQRYALEICRDIGCYCAVHAGSTVKGSNIEGLQELSEITDDDMKIHIAHINSYCRGQVTGNSVEEAGMALNIIKKMPNVRSESYLDIINGTSAKLKNGIPVSNVTKNCLLAKGYAVSAEGLEKAVKDGWARVNGKRGREIILLPPDEGYKVLKSNNSDFRVSFAVNSPGAAIGIATAKNNGKFIVDALSTDGGNIPRNTTLEKALCLVRFRAFSMLEVVEKACLAPAKMLGHADKGHFSCGADADITIVDPDSAKVEYVISAGRMVYHKGNFFKVAGKLFGHKKSVC